MQLFNFEASDANNGQLTDKQCYNYIFLIY